MWYPSWRIYTASRWSTETTIKLCFGLFATALIFFFHPLSSAGKELDQHRWRLLMHTRDVREFPWRLVSRVFGVPKSNSKVNSPSRCFLPKGQEALTPTYSSSHTDIRLTYMTNKSHTCVHSITMYRPWGHGWEVIFRRSCLRCVQFAKILNPVYSHSSQTWKSPFAVDLNKANGRASYSHLVMAIKSVSIQ